MNDRELILGKLKENTRKISAPTSWISRQNFSDLGGEFERSLRKVHGEVRRAKNKTEAGQILSELIFEVGATKIVANKDLPLSSKDLRNMGPEIEWLIFGESETEHRGEQLKEFCAAADIGLSGAEALLAETGTAVISSGSGLSRQATLLPPIHICVAPTTIITTDIFTWIADRKMDWAANVVLVSGPSKTADIEQTMAIGVHGPKRFIVILYEEGD